MFSARASAPFPPRLPPRTATWAARARYAFLDCRKVLWGSRDGMRGARLGRDIYGPPVVRGGNILACVRANLSRTLSRYKEAVRFAAPLGPGACSNPGTARRPRRPCARWHLATHSTPADVVYPWRPGRGSRGRHPGQVRNPSGGLSIILQPYRAPSRGPPCLGQRWSGLAGARPGAPGAIRAGVREYRLRSTVSELFLPPSAASPCSVGSLPRDGPPGAA